MEISGVLYVEKRAQVAAAIGGRVSVCFAERERDVVFFSITGAYYHYHGATLVRKSILGPTFDFSFAHEMPASFKNLSAPLKCALHIIAKKVGIPLVPAPTL